MDWLTKLWNEDFRGHLPPSLLPVAVLVLGGFGWRSIMRFLRRPERPESGLAAKVARAMRTPGYLLVLAVAAQVALVVFEPGRLWKNWVLGGNLLLNFSLVLFLGEVLFATLIDYYLREKHGTEIPGIFEQILKVVVYSIVVLSFLSTTFKIDITPLLTTSAVFTMVIGLALQDTLGNLFSGISVHISPPFRIGDWIEVGGFFGRVIESNWRSTTLRNADRDVIVVPNNEIAKKDIKNRSQRVGILFNDYFLGVSYDASPEQVRAALLGACKQVGEILRNPGPRIYMDGFQDFTITYRIRYWFKDSHSPHGVKDQLLSRIWYRLKRDGIPIPYPIREVNLHPEKDKRAEQVDRRLSLVSQVDFLRELERPHRVFLAERLKEYWYESGEKIVEKGSQGTEFFIIDQGRVAVFLDDEAASPVAELQSGSFFGEMSLLTGEPRSAMVRAEGETTLLVLNQETMSHLLREKPELASILSMAIAERSARNQEAKNARGEGGQGPRGPATREMEAIRASSVLLDRIKRFFRLI